MQISWPETSSKREFSTGIFLWILRLFRKTLFTEHIRMTACAASFVPTKVLCIDHTFFIFSFIFPFISNNCNYWNLFSLLLFPIIYQKINVNVVKKICLGNNLSITLEKILISATKNTSQMANKTSATQLFSFITWNAKP